MSVYQRALLEAHFETPLAVWGLERWASNAGGTGSIPGQGAKILHAAWPKQQKKSTSLGLSQTPREFTPSLVKYLEECACPWLSGLTFILHSLHVLLYIVSLSPYSSLEDHCHWPQLHKNSHKYTACPPGSREQAQRMQGQTELILLSRSLQTSGGQTSKQTLATKNGKCSDRRDEEALGEKERTTHPAGG